MKTLLTKNHLSFLTLAFFISLNSIAQVNLKITEIFSGQAGADLTPDWFEIKNTGSSTWMSGTDDDLFYDDDSQDPTKATLIEGISEIKAGEYAIILISNDPLDVAAFTTIWSSVINLSSIKIGYTDGAGLGAGGDLVTLWLGNPSTTSPIDTASYTATDNFDGLSYDVELASFSSIGNSNQAVQTTAMGGDNGDIPNIASPGNQGPAIIDGSAPSIVVDVTNTTSFLTLSEESPAYVSGVLNDPTDPAATLGIHFTVSDADTPLEDLTVTVTSSNQAVVLN